MRARRERARTEGYQFLLPDASRNQDGEPFFIRMRRLSLQERASVNGISEEMQTLVWEKTKALAESQQLKHTTQDPDEIMDLIRNNTALKEAVDTVVCAVVVDPPVTLDMSEAEANEDLWHVDDFTAEDKWSIYQAALDSNSKESQSLKLFRPESDSNVGNLGAMQASKTSKRTTVLEESV